MLSSIVKRQLSSAAKNKDFVLFYKYVPGILEKRGPYREEHLKNIFSFMDKGYITKAG